MNPFGFQCDAITRAGARCTRKNHVVLPCTKVFDARADRYWATDFKSVRLCWQHSRTETRLRSQGSRLKLHHGGWFGAFNRYRFGHLVINQPSVNWDAVKSLKVPMFWKPREEK